MFLNLCNCELLCLGSHLPLLRKAAVGTHFRSPNRTGNEQENVIRDERDDRTQGMIVADFSTQVRYHSCKTTFYCSFLAILMLLVMIYIYANQC